MNAYAAAARMLLGMRETIRRSVRSRALGQVAHDIECGTHSGIPPCCIAWFILVRMHQEPGSPEWLAYEHSLQEARPARNGKLGYAPCPECIKARRFVHVRSCRCEPGDVRTLAGVSADWRRRRRPLVRSRA